MTDHRLDRRDLLKTAGAGILAAGASGVAQATDEDDAETEDATEIQDWHDLDAVREDVDGDYVLVADLESGTDGYEQHVGDPEEGWEPIILFDGTFDGNENETVDLVIDRPTESAVGLFGSTNNAIIKNIGLTNVDVTGEHFVGGLVGANGNTVRNAYVEGKVTGDDLVGGLVGENDGDVLDSYAMGELSGRIEFGGLIGENREDATVENSHADVTIEGGGPIGGLIGKNNGTVTQSFATGDVLCNHSGLGGRVGGLIGRNSGDVTDSYATGEVTMSVSRWFVGGLVGNHRSGQITRCFATGDVSGEDRGAGGFAGRNSADIVKSYATGNVDGEEEVGGLVGSNSAEVTKSYAIGEVTGDLNVGGLIGDNSGYVSKSFATGLTFGTIRVGGVIGENDSGDVTDSYWDTESTERDDGIGNGDGNVTGLSTAEMQGESSANTMDDFDFDERWDIQTDPDDHPSLAKPETA